MFDQLPRPGGKNKIPHFPAKNGFGEFLGKDRGKSVVTREGNEKVISPALTLSLALSLTLSHSLFLSLSRPPPRVTQPQILSAQ